MPAFLGLYAVVRSIELACVVDSDLLQRHGFLVCLEVHFGRLYALISLPAGCTVVGVVCCVLAEVSSVTALFTPLFIADVFIWPQLIRSLRQCKQFAF